MDTIYDCENISITVVNYANEEFINLLKKTIYGKKGIRYLQTGQVEKIKDMVDSYYFYLLINNKIVGTYCLSKHCFIINLKEVTSFYGKYLAIDSSYEGKGYGNLIKEKSILYTEKKYEQPIIFYSYIENENYSSAKISKNKSYSTFGSLEAIIFSRLFPKQSIGFEKSQLKDRQEILCQLKLFYQDYNLLNLDHVFYNDNYFVLKINNEIVAGIQANPVIWKIINLPNFSGWIIKNILPHIPILKRLFNAKKYTFLAIEGIFFKGGKEKELIDLLESTLLHFEVNSALIMLDTKSKILEILNNSNLGLVNKIQKRTFSQVYIKSDFFDKSLSELPFYISSFDFT